jgi:hypothetical protein
MISFQYLDSETGHQIASMPTALLEPLKFISLPVFQTNAGCILFPTSSSQDNVLRVALYELAQKEGVMFRFNTAAVDVEPGSGQVTLDNGEQLSADLIVAADGFYSFMRKFVVENEDEKAEESNGSKKTVIISVSLPLENLSLDETLQPLLNPSLVRVRFKFVHLSYSSPCSGRSGWVMDLLVEAGYWWACSYLSTISTDVVITTGTWANLFINTRTCLSWRCRTRG